MRVAFFHSHKFRCSGDMYSSIGSLTEDVLSRYIGEKDELFVYARVVPANDGERLSEIRDKRIHIIPYKDVPLDSQIAIADFCIMRLPSPIGFRACCIARRLGKPYLVEVVGCVRDVYWNHSMLGKMLAFPAYMVMKSHVKRAEYVVYVTREFLQERYPCLGRSIGVSDVDMPASSAEVLERRLQRIRNRKEKIVLGTIGAVDVKYKGQERVIRALKLLSEQRNLDYEYWLIGPGQCDYLLNIARQYGVADRVRFLGPKSHDEVFLLLDEIDIYVQPSRAEGLCRAILEALSRGCPVIASDVGGNSELVNSEYLFHHTKKETKTIASLIASLTKEKMDEQARRNYSTATCYDRESLAHRWRTFYDEFRAVSKSRRDYS